MSAFAREREIPILQLKKPDRSLGTIASSITVRQYFVRAAQEGRFGVVAIVACQEFQWVLSARDRAGHAKAASFEYFREQRRVGSYYFYILDPEFGPGFIKFCTYAPWPGRVWPNGHEWVKRQARREGIEFTALHNGFPSCSEPHGCRRCATAWDPTTCRRSLTAGCSSFRPR